MLIIIPFLLTMIAAGYCADLSAMQPPPGYVLKMKENFSGSRLNTRRWRPERPWGGPGPYNGDRFDNVRVRDGKLRLMVRAKRGEEHAWNGGIRSGDSEFMRIAGFADIGINNVFKVPGWLEFRLRATDVRGIGAYAELWSRDFYEWPRGSTNVWVGEFDMIELVGGTPTTGLTGTIPWTLPDGQGPSQIGQDGLKSATYRINRRGWHTYTAHFTEQFLRLYVDGKLQHERDLSLDPPGMWRGPFVFQVLCFLAKPGSWAYASGGEPDWRRIERGDGYIEIDRISYYAPR